MTYEEAKAYAEKCASEHCLEYEVLETFERYIEAGDEPLKAANCALYDWDI